MAGTKRTRAQLTTDPGAPFRTGNVPVNQDFQNLAASGFNLLDDDIADLPADAVTQALWQGVYPGPLPVVAGDTRYALSGLLNKLLSEHLAKFSLLGSLSDAAGGAAMVGYLAPFTGAAGRSLRTRLSDVPTVRDFGAIGGNETKDTEGFQKALDYGGAIIVPRHTGSRYRIGQTLKAKAAGGLFGENRGIAGIDFVGTGPVIESNTKGTATLLWFSLENLFIGAGAASPVLVDWQSIQFGGVRNCWLYGGAGAGSIGIRGATVYGTTECTYNQFFNNYFGNTQYGYHLSDGCNGNTIFGGRAQLPLASAVGALLTATALDRVNGNLILGFRCEQTGHTMTGVQLNGNTVGNLIIGCRFEQLLRGVLLSAGDERNALIANYYGDCTSKWLDGGTDTLILEEGLVYAHNVPRAEAVWDGTAGVAYRGTPRGCTVTRTGTGVYVVAFPTAMPNANYRVSLSSSAFMTQWTGPTTGQVTINTYNAAGIAADAALISVQITV